MDQREYIRQEYKKGTPLIDIARALNMSRDAVQKRAKRDPECPTHPRNKVIAETVQEPSQEQLESFRRHCEAYELPFNLWQSFWHKTGEYSAFFANKEAVDQYKRQCEELIEDIKRHAPKYKAPKTKPTGDHMLVLPQADIHVGKWLSTEETGHVYNMGIAEKRARDGTYALLEKAQLHGLKEFVICIGNDILHTDNGRSSTAGTPQDNDGSWFMNYRVARQVYVEIIEALAAQGNVLIVFVPSNHDWRSGFSLAETVAAHFVHHPNVTFMGHERHRKYVVFGQNLLMFSHGDGAKEKDLHWHLATEAAKAWAATRYRYVYLGHVHHKIRKTAGHANNQSEKDNIGFTEIKSAPPAEPTRDINIEYVRSPSPPDGWHDRNGYINLPAMEAYLHHPQLGQTTRFTHYFT